MEMFRMQPAKWTSEAIYSCQHVARCEIESLKKQIIIFFYRNYIRVTEIHNI